mmetsp:Transcript_3948/g.6752  ORF Transcript_3948/g.6752 Transcript_3948/m.6752 type:complete len:239 (-) Transcript_3948:540-1256(-)
MHFLKPSSSSLRLSPLPMKTSLLILFSPSFQIACEGPKLICSWTPWKTNLTSPWPAIDSTPLLRYRSLALACSSCCMKELNTTSSRSPSNMRPTEPTPERSWIFLLVFRFLESGSKAFPCSPSSSSSRRNSGSTSSVFSIENEFTPRMRARSTVEFRHSMSSANLLTELMVPRTSASSSALTRSVLLRSTRSANATCCTASFTALSGFTSSRCCLMCLQSTRHKIESILNALLMSGLM